MKQTKKLSRDMMVEEIGGFIRICYIEINGEESNETLMSEEEAKNLHKFLEKFDYSNIKRSQKLRELKNE